MRRGAGEPRELLPAAKDLNPSPIIRIIIVVLVVVVVVVVVVIMIIIIVIVIILVAMIAMMQIMLVITIWVLMIVQITNILPPGMRCMLYFPPVFLPPDKCTCRCLRTFRTFKQTHQTYQQLHLNQAVTSLGVPVLHVVYIYIYT